MKLICKTDLIKRELHIHLALIIRFNNLDKKFWRFWNYWTFVTLTVLISKKKKQTKFAPIAKPRLYQLTCSSSKV